MTRNAAMLWGAAVLAGAVAIGQGSHQDWEVRRTGDFDSVLFTVKRFETGRGRWVSTFRAPLSRFHGLNPDLMEHGGKVQFEYVQDAGKLVCKGRFMWGSGSGSFDFVPNPQYAVELKKLGYDAPKDDQLFSMMMNGLTLEYARTVKEAGLTASLAELEELRNSGLSLEFIRDVRLEGYRDLTAREFIDLRNQGVATGFLRSLKEAGYTLSPHEMVELHNFGVDGRFLKELQTYGLHPAFEELKNFKMQGISPRYLDALRGAGYNNLAAHEIVELHQNGVSTDFVRATTELGYKFSPGELVDLQRNGVDGRYLRRLRDSGMRSLSAQEITKLHQNGVD